MRIRTKDDLITYTKRKIGDGYTQVVDIPEEGYQDAVDDAVEMFINRVYQGTQDEFIKVPITDGVNDYTLPDNVLAVYEILTEGDYLPMTSPIQGYSFTTEFAGYEKLDIIDYVLWNNVISTYKHYSDDPYMFNYNQIYHRLRLFVRPKNTSSILVHCVTHPEESDPEFADIYSHDWIKGRVYVNVLERWCVAHIKHTGSLMDGNIEIDKNAIRELWQIKLEESNNELENVYCGVNGAIYD